MEVVVTAGAIGRAKLQSNHYHQQTNTKSFLQAGCPSCRPTNSVEALKRKVIEQLNILKVSCSSHCCHLSALTRRRHCP